MTFYEILKAKAKNPKYNDKHVIMGRVNQGKNTLDYAALKYADLLKMVDIYINKLQEAGYVTSNDIGKRKYVIIDNSINSIAITIALLKLNVIPVLVDYKNLEIEETDYLPHIYSSRNLENEFDEFLIKVSNYIRDYLNSNEKLPYETSEGGKLIICSSGSECLKPHLNLIKESDLINLPNQYGENESHFYSYISCANISGILTNIVNPIVNDCTVMLSESFNLEGYYFNREEKSVIEHEIYKKFKQKDYIFSIHDFDFMHYLLLRRSINDHIIIENNKVRVLEWKKGYREFCVANDFEYCNIDTMPDIMMFPRNILEYLKKIDTSKLDFSCVKRIYLAGGINSQEIINNVRRIIPSIPEGIITNLYGSTEANGVICSCREEKLKTCYINISKFKKGIIEYSYDQKHVFRLQNGKVKEINKKYSAFEFAPYLSVSEGLIPDIIVDGINIKYKNNITSDLGVYIDNQLYILGRKSDLVKIYDRDYNIIYIEQHLSRMLGIKVYCIKDPNGEAIQPYLCYSKDHFEEGLKLYKKALKIIDFFQNMNINHPVLLNDHVFPMSKISGKVSRAKLIGLRKYSEIQYNNFMGDYCENLRRLGQEFIRKYFSDYEVTPIDEELCFSITLKDNFFFPYYESINYLFDVIDIDDEKGIIVLHIKPQILFFVDEEFTEKLDEKLVEDYKDSCFTKYMIYKNAKTIDNFQYKDVYFDHKIDRNDLDQLTKNFLKKYKEYLIKHIRYSDPHAFDDIPPVRIILSKEQREKIHKLFE